MLSDKKKEVGFYIILRFRSSSWTMPYLLSKAVNHIKNSFSLDACTSFFLLRLDFKGTVDSRYERIEPEPRVKIDRKSHYPWALL